MRFPRIFSMILIALLSAVALSAATDLPFEYTFGGLMVFSFLVPRRDGVLNVALFDLAGPSSGNPGAGGGIADDIILIPDENIDWSQFPSRTLNGSTIAMTIPLKAGKYMHRFYGTYGSIVPTMKKLNGTYRDSGGYQVGVESFHPGMNADILGWLDSFTFPFKGLVIIQNCSDNKRYLFGEPCNLMYVDAAEMLWGAEVEKDKGNKITFSGKQSRPIAIYTGSLIFDPGSTSW